MAKNLAYTVWFNHPESGELVSFGPGDKVPAWAAKQIGPHAYEDYDPTNPDAADPAPDPAADDEHAPPPKSGRGSGVGAWRDYLDDETVAAQLTEKNVDIPAEATREEIIAALDKAGIRTE